MPNKAYVDTLIYPLCHMLELAHLKGTKNAQQEDALIEKIIQYIKKNYSQHITSESICKKFNCSRAHFSKLFNAQAKIPFREYITRLRIEAAKSLLGFSNLDVSEIALSVGFNEPNYFTSVFKKHVGVSPSAYKKSQQP